MRIVHIINSLESGGAEKLLLDTLPLYKKKKVTVDLLVLNGFNYPFMKALRSLNCCSIYSLNLGSAYNPLAILKIIPFLKKYDIAHVHLFPTQYWVVIAKLLSGSKIKLVYTEHSTSGRRINSRFFQRLDPYFYKRYNKIIAISEAVATVIHKHTGLGHAVELIPNGVLLETFRNSKPTHRSTLFPGSDSSLKTIIQIASFKEPKDQKTVIKSLLYLPTEVQLVLVGDGELKNDCIKLVNELKLAQRVVFLGIRLDVPELIKMADIVIISSKYEGFSLAAVEGMAAGKPVIATNVAAVNTLVDGAGILFKEGDAEQLAAEVIKLVDNEMYYQAIAKKCSLRAKQYDIDSMVDKQIELYKKL